MAKKGPQSNKEAFRSIAELIRIASTRPNILGYLPHDKQIDFHSSQARGRLFIGGNRSGKTVGGATEMIWWLTGKHPYRNTPPPPVRGRCISVDFKNGVEQIVKPEIARWIPKSELKDGSWERAFSKEHQMLTLENGSTLEFMSYDQDLEKHAGTSRHCIWFDEEPPNHIFVENKLRLLDTGGDWWITMTPVEGMTWIYDDVYIAARTDDLLHVTEVDTTENPNLNAGEIEITMSGLTADEKKARIKGQFVQRGGLIYPNFTEKNIIDPIIAKELNQNDWLHLRGMDHGINNPTAWLFGAVSRDGVFIIYDEIYQSGKVIAEIAPQVTERSVAYHNVIPSYSVGDPSIRNTDPITGTSVLIEYIKYGIPIVLGNNDVPAGLNLVRKLLGETNNDQLKTRLYITKNCPNLLHEIQRYRWATWATKKHNFENNKKEEPHKKDDHACDALRYIAASRPEVEDHSIPEVTIPPGAVEPVMPYAPRIDPGVSRETARISNFDYVLGNEW